MLDDCNMTLFYRRIEVARISSNLLFKPLEQALPSIQRHRILL